MYETYLKNGIEVIYHQHHNTNVQIGWLIHTGMQDESPNLCGITHLVEHLICNNIQQLVSKTLDTTKYKANAYTTSTITYYYITADNGNINTLLKNINSEWIHHKLSDKTVQNEKENVLKELITTFATNKEKTSITKVFEQWNNRHHLAYKTICNINNTLHLITNKDIIDFIEKYYRPDNITLLVFAQEKIENITSLFRNSLNNVLDMKNSILEINKEEKPIKVPYENKKLHFEHEENAFYLSFRIKKNNPHIYQYLLSILHFYNNCNELKYPKWVEKKSVKYFSTGYTDQNFIIIKGAINEGKEMTDKEKLKKELYSYIFDIHEFTNNGFKNKYYTYQKNNNLNTVNDIVYWVNHNRLFNKKNLPSTQKNTTNNEKWERVKLSNINHENVSENEIKYAYDSIFSIANAKFLLLH